MLIKIEKREKKVGTSVLMQAAGDDKQRLGYDGLYKPSPFHDVRIYFPLKRCFLEPLYLSTNESLAVDSKNTKIITNNFI